MLNLRTIFLPMANYLCEANAQLASGSLTAARAIPASTPAPRRSAVCIALLLTAVLAQLSGCASAPKPVLQASASVNAIASAEAAGAEQDAPVELRFAKEQQGLAEVAMQKYDNAEAQLLFERAAIHAELARLKAKALQANQAISRTRAEQEALKEQLAAAREGLGGSAKRRAKASGEQP